MSTFLVRTGTAALLAAVFVSIVFYMPPLIFSILLCTLLLYILIYEWPLLIKPYPKAGWFFSVLYPGISFVLLLFLNQSPQYHALIVPLFIITASYDTSAYIIGSLWGNHKIAPHISPGKSYEGLIGGYLTALITLLCIQYLRGVSIHLLPAIVVAACICICAFVGDLFESWLKRKARIKDISSLLPGHGGFLDRFDSIVVVTLFFYLFRTYLITLF